MAFYIPYKVNWGDSLSDIAKRFQADASEIINGDDCFPGQLLNIPQNEPKNVMNPVPVRSLVYYLQRYRKRIHFIHSDDFQKKPQLLIISSANDCLRIK